MFKKLITFVMVFLAMQGYLVAESLRIESIDIETSGSTSSKAVSNYLEIEIGDEYATEEELVKALNSEAQRLQNLQVFKSVTATHTPTPGVLGGVDVDIIIQDSWNLFPVPVFRYDSNVGWKLGAKLKYPNAFGSLMNLEANAYIEQRNSSWKKSVIYGDLILNRIRLFNSYSSIKFSSDYNLGSKTFNMDLTTAVGFNIVKQPMTGHFRFRKAGSAYHSDFGLSTRFLFARNNLRYTPKITFEFKHNGGAFNDHKNILITQTVSMGGINWRNYFREGFSITATNNLRFYLAADAPQRVYSDLFAQVTQFIMFDNSNLKWRITGVGRTSGNYGDLGKYMRGVLNRSLQGPAGIFGSIDWVLRVATWDSTGYFKRIEGGEFHLAPFVDIGFVSTSESSKKQGFESSFGAEGVFFFDKARSIKLSGLLGISANDLFRKIKGDGNGAIEKEIIISFSISY